jgi:hypothetical protein
MLPSFLLPPKAAGGRSQIGKPPLFAAAPVGRSQTPAHGARTLQAEGLRKK